MSKKANSVPSPIPDLNGYPTPERLRHAGNGVSYGEFEPRLSASVVNSPIRPKNAPNNATKSPLEEALKPHELATLIKVVDAACVVNGKPKASSIEGGGIISGKRSGGALPYKSTDAQLFAWYQRIMGADTKYKKFAVADYVKCGIEFYYRISIGEGDGFKLEDVGLAMCRIKNPEAIKGGYISFYITCINAVYHAEKLIIREIIEEKRSKTLV